MTMKAALDDEHQGIMQIAFLPEAEEGTRTGIVVPGEDIPNDTGRPRDDRRGTTLSVATNTHSTDSKLQ